MFALATPAVCGRASPKPSPRAAPPPHACNGYKLLLFVDPTTGNNWNSPVGSASQGSTTAAAECTATPSCASFNTNFNGSSTLFSSTSDNYVVTHDNRTQGTYVKTCDPTTSGYAAVNGWDWGGGGAAQTASVVCKDALCCKGQCDVNPHCDVFTFDVFHSTCAWERVSSSMKAGGPVSRSITSYMKLSSLL